MYEVILLNSAAKLLRNLDKPIKNRIIAALEQIAENPWHGERLKGDLTEIYSFHLKIAGVEYRITYQIKEQETIIVIVLIGTRENFYDELKRRIKD